MKLVKKFDGKIYATFITTNRLSSTDLIYLLDQGWEIAAQAI